MQMSVEYACITRYKSLMGRVSRPTSRSTSAPKGEQRVARSGLGQGITPSTPSSLRANTTRPDVTPPIPGTTGEPEIADPDIARVANGLTASPGTIEGARQALVTPHSPNIHTASRLSGLHHDFDDPNAPEVSSPARATALLAQPQVGEGLDAKVLVLNKFYAAVRVISARRAFSLLVRDAAEIIDVNEGQYLNYNLESWIEVAEIQRSFEPDRHDWVRTVRFEIAVPRIIRLLGYDRLPDQKVKLNRRNLFARDRNQCQYCGKFFPTSELSIDHVIPRSQDGPDTWENLVCACVKCNAKKGGRTPEQAQMKLIRPAKRPKRNPLITIKLGHNKYDSWKTFLDEAYWSVELK